jgi:hypothetical protein
MLVIENDNRERPLILYEIALSLSDIGGTAHVVAPE